MWTKHRLLALGILLVILGVWLLTSFFAGPQPGGYYDVYIDGHYYVYNEPSARGDAKVGVSLKEISYEEAHKPPQDALFLKDSSLWKPVEAFGFAFVIFGGLALISGIQLIHEARKAQ